MNCRAIDAFSLKQKLMIRWRYWSVFVMKPVPHFKPTDKMLYTKRAGWSG